MEEGDSIKQLRSLKSALAKAQFRYWEHRQTHELRFGDKDLASEMGRRHVDPIKKRREQNRVGKKERKEKKTKAIKVVPKGFTCQGTKVHGEGCKGTTDATKEPAKTESRHEGVLYPVCKGCKKFIAQKRKAERAQ